MTRSMTAFARVQKDSDAGTLIWEIRSVNHRYLEPQLRLPETLRLLEPEVRQRLRQRLKRGKVECSLRLEDSDRQPAQIAFNQPLADSLRRTAETLADQLRDPAPIDPLEVLRWPGVLETSRGDPEALQQAALEGFDDALTQLEDNRAREGDALAALIHQRLDAMDAIVREVRRKMPRILQRQREQLLQRLAEVREEMEPARLEQELVLQAQKADVDEETDRLATHLQEVRRTLGRDEAIGRRLDFLMQELNREANTLSSKSIVAETTQCAVELKVLIEQMREQVQNIE